MTSEPGFLSFTHNSIKGTRHFGLNGFYEISNLHHCPPKGNHEYAPDP